MGDSTSMTIEFLRARLLSERTVSKAAKERADQLAKRVTELEEQLRIITSQRRKTEQAAMEAISILENFGINNLSEADDSSSEKDESHSTEKGYDETCKEDEASTASKGEKVDVEDAQSSSELEVSPSQVGSLSWKGRSSSPASARKLKGKQFKLRQRRISLMSSTESSPKYNLGMSCRKIKRKDVGSTDEDKGDDHMTCSDDRPDLSGNASASHSSSLNIQKQIDDSNNYVMGSDRDEEMERVLEQQAQLIGQYEAEEKAQREWEKKYNENKSSNLEKCESGKQHHEGEINCDSQKESTSNFQRIPHECEDEKSSICTSSWTNEPGCLSDDRVLESSDAINQVMDDAVPHANSKQLFSDFSEPEKKHECKETKSGIPFSTRTTTNELGCLSDDPMLNSSYSASQVPGDGDQDANIVETSTVSMPTNTPRSGSGSDSKNCVDNLMGQAGKHVAVNAIEARLEVALSAKLNTVSSPRQKQDHSLIHENSDSWSSNNVNMRANYHRVKRSQSNSPSIGSPSTAKSGREITLWESPGNQDPSSIKASQSAASSSLGSVLEALERAKISLRQELYKSPLPDQVIKALPAPINFQVRTPVPGENMKLPTGSSGLFRLPTDSLQYSEHEVHGSRLSSAACYPHLGSTMALDDYCHSTRPYVEAGSMRFTGIPDFGNYHSNMDLPSSARYSLPYTGLIAGDKSPFTNETEFSLAKQQLFNTYSQGRGSRYSLPLDLMTSGIPLTNKSGSSPYSPSFDPCHLGTKTSFLSGYSSPYSDVTIRDGISKPYTDGINRMPPQSQ